MKKIKIKFVDFGTINKDGFYFDNTNNFIVDLLKKYYTIEFSEEPDYIFYSDYGSEHFRYNCIRIYFALEYIVPDFNVCDYAFGFSHLEFEDRYFRYLPYLTIYSTKVINEFQNININTNDLENKQYFCGFVHENGNAKFRNEVFEKLSEYQKVTSGGRYKNNLGYFVKNKVDFFKECKFVLCIENSYGFSSGRIIEAYASKAIPIYWGDKNGVNEFNPDTFVNLHDFDSLNDAIELIKKINQDDTIWYRMINSKKILKDDYISVYNANLELFLKNIFDQNKEESYRRNRDYRGYVAEQIVRIGTEKYERHIKQSVLLGKIFFPLKKTKLAKKIKDKVILLK
jgi:hypothetical protein